MQQRLEDKIQNSLKEFSIEPSEHIWVGIDAAINTEKKRRVIAWWLPVAGILLIAAIGSVIYTTTTKKTISFENENKVRATAANTHQNLISEKKNINLVREASTASKTLQLKNIAVAKTKNLIAKNTTESYLIKEYADDENNQMYNAETIQLSNDNINITEQKLYTANAKGAYNHIDEILKLNTTVHQQNLSNQNLVKNIPVLQKHKQANKLKLYFLGEVALFNEKSTNLGAEKSSFENIGFATSGGQNLFSPNQSLTVPNAGFAGKLGIMVEKNINNKFSLNAAVFYQFITNKQAVGNRVDTSFGVYYKMNNTASIANNIHAIGIQINGAYNFLNKKNYSAFAGGGISLQGIVSKKWLVPDADIKGYRYDNSLPNNFQAALQINTGIKLKNDTRFLLQVAVPVSNFYSNQLASRTYLQTGIQIHYPIGFIK